jgi:hypothetical protein
MRARPAPLARFRRKAMTPLCVLEAESWGARFGPDDWNTAARALEAGKVLYFPRLAFPLAPADRRFLSPAILGRAKNVSYDPATGRLGGTICSGRDAVDLADMLRRYADAALGLMRRLLPSYVPALVRGRTSLRPALVEGRKTSWRKDDTRLHVDSFPSQPTGGRRLLRIFCNVNPAGRPRSWRVGEPFADLVERYWAILPAPRWGERRLLSWLRVTKGLRTDYDHYMLRLHDTMKADEGYQRSAPQTAVDFPSGSAWACFTDQVSHAAMAGQHQFEQTFTLPVEALEGPETAPLRVLERQAGRPLVPPVGRRAA